MKLTNEQIKSAIIKRNKKLVYKALGTLRSEGVLRIWNGSYLCKDQAREEVKRKGCVGGWSLYWDYEGVMRPDDIAIQFGGSNGIRQERWVAMRILEVLRSAGLAAQWRGSLKKKILVDMSHPVWD